MRDGGSDRVGHVRAEDFLAVNVDDRAIVDQHVHLDVNVGRTGVQGKRVTEVVGGGAEGQVGVGCDRDVFGDARHHVGHHVESGVVEIVAITDPLSIGFTVQAMIGLTVDGDIEAR